MPNAIGSNCRSLRRSMASTQLLCAQLVYGRPLTIVEQWRAHRSLRRADESFGRQQQHKRHSVALATVNFKLNFAFVSLSAENY